MKSASSLASGERIKIIVYTKEGNRPPVMATLVQQLEAQRARVECDILGDSSKVLPAVAQTGMSILILGLAEREELVQILNILTQVQDRIQTGLLRVILLNGMDHPRVIALLKAKGVQEVLEFGTPIKALNHKIKNAFVLVNQAFQRQQSRTVRSSATGDGESRERVARPEVTSDVQWEKPVGHPTDYWWIPSKKNVRQLMGRWLIDLLGPGPAVGAWEEVK